MFIALFILFIYLFQKPNKKNRNKQQIFWAKVHLGSKNNFNSFYKQLLYKKNDHVTYWFSHNNLHWARQKNVTNSR